MKKENINIESFFEAIDELREAKTLLDDIVSLMDMYSGRMCYRDDYSFSELQNIRKKNPTFIPDKNRILNAVRRYVEFDDSE